MTLGYELVWNQKRHCCAVRLFVDSHNTLDARHLVATLSELWPVSAPILLLQARDPSLLAGLLEHAPVRSLWLEVRDTQLSNPALVANARKALSRGLTVVWSGEPGQAPPASLANAFQKCLRSLTPHQALAALRVSQQKQARNSALSPVVASNIYEGLASPVLLEHALDHQGAWGVAGWPMEEVLHGYRLKQMQPSRQQLRAVVAAIEADKSLDVLEHRLGEEPLLAYRFLRYANSAHLGARCEVTTLRQGLMLMGYSKLRNWLMEQVPQASNDPNLNPIRSAMVLRARVMERLAQAGVEDELRSEVFLCGIFSQLDILLGEPLGGAIHRLPLPGRIASAVVGQTGPYATWLAVASALESSNTRMIREVCRAHKMPAGEVNRALLRTLATVVDH